MFININNIMNTDMKNWQFGEKMFAALYYKKIM